MLNYINFKTSIVKIVSDKNIGFNNIIDGICILVPLILGVNIIFYIKLINRYDLCLFNEIYNVFKLHYLLHIMLSILWFRLLIFHVNSSKPLIKYTKYFLLDKKFWRETKLVKLCTFAYIILCQLITINFSVLILTMGDIVNILI
jgi:hypothetical protein